MKKLYLLCFLYTQFISAQLSLPYENNFNHPTSDEGWTHYALSGTDSWERGNDTNVPDWPDFTWSTNLNGSPAANSVMALETPAFDLTNADLPYVISFQYDSDINSGNFYLDYSLDNGTTWILLNFDGAQKRSWQSTYGFTLSSSSFIRYPALNISALAGNSNVKFRFRFRTTNYVNGFGCKIDNFAIKSEYYNVYAGVGEPIEISPLCPEIEVVTDLYFDNQYSSSYPIETQYFLSTDTQLDESDVFLGSQSSNVSSTDSTYDYVLTNPGNLTPGQYYVVYKHDYLDAVAENDEDDNVSYASLLVKPIYTMPYSNDFEQEDNNWAVDRNTYQDMDIWERGEGTRHHIEKTHSGDYAWHTSNSQFPHPDYASQYVGTPYFNLASSSEPLYLSFWFKANYPNGVGYYDNEYIIQYTLNCDTYWQTLYTIPENMTEEWEFINIPLSTTLSSNENVRFRISYHNEYIDPEGLIFDDFYIGPLKPDVSIEKIYSNNRFTTSNNSTDVLTYNLVNAGTDLSTAVVTDFYWSTDEVLDNSDVLLGSKTTSSINGDLEGLWETFTYTKPTFATGNYYIIYEIDASNSIEELREYNNIGVIPIEQTQPFSFPYYNDFEGDVTGWVHDATLGNDDWELATPQGVDLDAAFSGEKAFITNASGQATSMSRMHLYTPVFDLSGSLNPVMEFDMKLISYMLCHCFEFTMNFSYSVDNGATWQLLSPVNDSYSKWIEVLEYEDYDGTDVYNGSQTSEALFEKSELVLSGFMGYNSRDVDRNTKYIINIPQLANETNVRFRFNVGTINNDGTGNGISEGAMIDNFQIREAEVDLLVPYVKNLYLSTTSPKLNLSMDVKNVGNYISTDSNIKFYLSQDDSYDSGDPFIGVKNLDPIKPDTNQHIIAEFSLPSDLSTYSHLLYVIDDIDANNELDESNNVGVWPLGLGGITQFPYLETFEADIIDGWKGWAYDDWNSTVLTNYRVRNKLVPGEVEREPFRIYDGILRTEQVPYGSWLSSLTPLYLIQSPTFDFTNTDTSEPLFMSFDMMCIGKYNENGGNMEYSLNGGQSWTLLTINSSPYTENWYPNYTSMSDMDGEPGWYEMSGEIIAVKMDISFLQSQSNVTFRYKYFSNFASSSYAPEGFRIDNFVIGNQNLIDDLDCMQDVPYAMEFDNFEAPCWVIDGVEFRNVNEDIQWTIVDNFSNDTSQFSAKVDIVGHGDEDGTWLISPNFNVDVSSTLSINIALTDFGTFGSSNLGTDDEVKLMYTTDNGTTWQTLRTWNASTPISNNSESIYENILPSDFVKFAFWATNGAVSDGNGITFYVSSFSIEEGTLSVVDTGEPSEIVYYPNPVQDQLNIASTMHNLQSIHIYNVAGQLMFESSPNSQSCTLNFSDYESGIYLVKVFSENGFKVLRIVKK